MQCHCNHKHETWIRQVLPEPSWQSPQMALVKAVQVLTQTMLNSPSVESAFRKRANRVDCQSIYKKLFRENTLASRPRHQTSLSIKAVARRLQHHSRDILPSWPACRRKGSASVVLSNSHSTVYNSIVLHIVHSRTRPPLFRSYKISLWATSCSMDQEPHLLPQKWLD